MLPSATISHKTPNRLRLKIPSKKGDSIYFVTLEQELTKLREIEGLQTNPLTSSVLIMHNSDADILIQFAQKNNLFTLEQPIQEQQNNTVSRSFLGGFHSINNVLKKFTKREFDLATIAFLALLGVAVYQIAIGNFRAKAPNVTKCYNKSQNT
jgi:chaperonin GroEL (HSP60 family)